MALAFLWGFVAAASLLIGAVIAIRGVPGPKLVGLVMAFGSGVLISAVAFELVAKGVEVDGDLGGVTVGLFAGCAVYALGDLLLARWAHTPEPGAGRVPAGRADEDDEAGGGLSIALGALLDGIPESAALGLSILQGGSVSVAMLAAVFVSNLPEAIAATSSLRQSGWSDRKVLTLWAGVVAACGLSSGLGYALLDQASPSVLAFVFAFAAGAILTMLSTSLIPGAYRFAGREAGPITVVGFGVAFALTWIA